MVGAYLWSGDVGSGEGIALVFHGSTSGLASTAAWSYEGGQIAANLGNSVSTAGDVNDDGYSDVIVGANLWHGVGIHDGMALVFLGSSAGLATTADWSHVGSQEGARLGWVSTAGDVNGDGYSDVIVGASNWDGDVGNYEGAAFVFHGSTSGLTRAAAWSFESGQAGAHLFPVSDAGDINGDGYDDVIVGAPWWDLVGGVREGAVWVFNGSPSGLASTPTWRHTGDRTYATLGVSVSTAGDINSDGYSDVIIGAWQWDGSAGSGEGAAFVFHGSERSSALPCALNAVDLATSPLTPPRVSPWVYDLDCGSSARVNPGLPIGRQVSAAPVVDWTTFDTADPSMASTLTVYQLGCSCVDVILIVKDRGANELVLR